jgi:hypothetical protein
MSDASTVGMTHRPPRPAGGEGPIRCNPPSTLGHLGVSDARVFRGVGRARQSDGSLCGSRWAPTSAELGHVYLRVRSIDGASVNRRPARCLRVARLMNVGREETGRPLARWAPRARPEVSRPRCLPSHAVANASSPSPDTATGPRATPAGVLIRGLPPTDDQRAPPKAGRCGRSVGPSPQPRRGCRAPDAKAVRPLTGGWV